MAEQRFVSKVDVLEAGESFRVMLAPSATVHGLLLGPGRSLSLYVEDFGERLQVEREFLLLDDNWPRALPDGAVFVLERDGSVLYEASGAEATQARLNASLERARKRRDEREKNQREETEREQPARAQDVEDVEDVEAEAPIPDRSDVADEPSAAAPAPVRPSQSATTGKA